MRIGPFERIEVKLRVLTPVFIGSGEELTKKEYIFDETRGIIHMPDLRKLAAFLSARSLIPAYQEYMLDPGKNNLRIFLREKGIDDKYYPSFVQYSIDAGEAAASGRFRGVLTFIKGPDGRPYIPGSSLKGAIRTAVAAKLIKQDNYVKFIDEIERESGNLEQLERNISKVAGQLEVRLFNRLDVKDPRDPEKIKRHDAVNDFMQGIKISDSLPMEFENLTLCGKYDRLPDGTVRKIPLFRECLAPGTETRFWLTIDRSIMNKAGINIEFIEDALRGFYNSYKKSFEQYFKVLAEDYREETGEEAIIILGGGAGYVAKTLIYPLIPERDRAVKLVSKIMTRQFNVHKHDRDPAVYKVSPRMLKTTMYKGVYYPMGKCAITFG